MVWNNNSQRILRFKSHRPKKLVKGQFEKAKASDNFSPLWKEISFKDITRPVPSFGMMLNSSEHPTSPLLAILCENTITFTARIDPR
jgi:hypothetical protein